MTSIHTLFERGPAGGRVEGRAQGLSSGSENALGNSQKEEILCSPVAGEQTL